MPKEQTIYKIGSFAAFAQLFVILAYAIIGFTVGPRLQSAHEIYSAFQTEPIQTFLRGDLLLVILVGLYLFTFPSLYFALRDRAPATSILTLLLTIIAVIISFTGESTFALWHLFKKYEIATTNIERNSILAAGEAILSNGWWNSSASYIVGIFLQGSGIIFSIVMIKSPKFSKITAISGLLANSFDLIQHILEPFMPGTQALLSPIMGPFYLIWFPMLGFNIKRLTICKDIQ